MASKNFTGILKKAERNEEDSWVEAGLSHREFVQMPQDHVKKAKFMSD